MDYEHYMKIALEEANLAELQGEVPIGAIIIDINSGEIIAQAHNNPIEAKDPTAHAEINAIRIAAQKLENYRLKPELCMFVTLEPCVMCAGAITNSRITKLVYGAKDEKGGAIDSGVKFFNSPTCHHAPEVVSGIYSIESSTLLKNFFKKRRAKK